MLLQPPESRVQNTETSTALSVSNTIGRHSARSCASWRLNTDRQLELEPARRVRSLKRAHPPIQLNPSVDLPTNGQLVYYSEFLTRCAKEHYSATAGHVRRGHTQRAKSLSVCGVVDARHGHDARERGSGSDQPAACSLRGSCPIRPKQHSDCFQQPLVSGGRCRPGGDDKALVVFLVPRPRAPATCLLHGLMACPYACRVRRGQRAGPRRDPVPVRTCSGLQQEVAGVEGMDSKATTVVLKMSSPFFLLLLACCKIVREPWPSLLWPKYVVVKVAMVTGH